MTLAISYTLLIALGLSLAILIIVHVVSSVRHNKALATIGPLETEEAINARIESKREEEDQLREKINKLNEAFVEKAEKQAEVDGLLRRRDELLAEWNSLNEKREEVREVRAESEKAMLEKSDIDNKLSEVKAELEQVSNKLQIAEDLVKQIDSLKSEQSQLEQKVEELGEIAKNLEEDEKRVKGLLEIEDGLNESIQSIENEISTKEAELKELTEQTESQESELGNVNSKLEEISSQKEQANSELAETNADVKRMRAETVDLEAKHVQLSALIASSEIKLEDLKSGIEISQRELLGKTGDEEPDPKVVLRGLNRQPVAIEHLTQCAERGSISEKEALEEVKSHFSSHGLEFSDRTLFAFHTALKVNESTQMAVLAGISGTGKSQLPRQYANGMGIGFLQVPVQPRWDSPQDLMGFYNYIENKYVPTELARTLWALDGFNNENAVEDKMMLILLDEMNLARVEYYFSDFLSRLESRPQESAVKNESSRKDAEFELEIPKLQEPPRIFPNFNLLFTGSMNEDETTQSLSEKVIDRANVLRFAAPKELKTKQIVSDEIGFDEALSYSCWRSWIESDLPDETELTEISRRIYEMKEIMDEFGRPFGHRLGYAMTTYAIQYPKTFGINSMNHAVADQVEMRLLPKLRGIEMDNTDVMGAFDRLQKFVQEDLEDDKLATAIEDWKSKANETGQFVWGGVVR